MSILSADCICPNQRAMPEWRVISGVRPGPVSRNPEVEIMQVMFGDSSTTANGINDSFTITVPAGQLLAFMGSLITVCHKANKEGLIVDLMDMGSGFNLLSFEEAMPRHFGFTPTI